MLGHALASTWHQDLIREFKLPTEDEAGRFARTLAAWNAASDLDPEPFRESFTHGLVDKPATVARLRQAAAGSAEAKTIGQMVDASRPLTQAIRDIGAHGWEDVREGLADKAAAAMPAQFAAPVGTPILATGNKTRHGKIVLAGASEEEINPREAIEPEAGVRSDLYNIARRALQQLNPNHPELEGIYTWDWVPDNRALDRLRDAIREEYRDAWTMLETLDPGNPAIKNRADPSATPSPQEIEELRKAVLKTYRKIRTSPQPKATTSPVITPNELENKTVEEITEIARQKGLILSKMDGKT